jgi:hypothetical protein
VHNPYNQETGRQLWAPVLDVPEADRSEWAEGDGYAVEVWDIHMGERLEELRNVKDECHGMLYKGEDMNWINVRSCVR